MFYPFGNESALLPECDGTYTSKLIEQHVLEVVNRKKLIIEPHRDIVDSAISSYKIEYPHNMDSSAQQENEETNEERELNNVQEINEEGSSSDYNIDFSVSGSSSVPADSDAKSNIRSLNRDQRNVFEDVHRWSRQNMSNAGHPKFNMKWNQWGWLWKVKFTQDNLPSSH